MRIRSIKPEFWQSETMASVDPFSRLMAIALLNLSDDHGYFNATPAVVRGEVFPFEESLANVSRALSELSRVGYICIGTTSTGKRVGSVVNFKMHQKVDHPSRLTFDVDSIVWDKKTIDSSRDPRETVASPRETLDHEHGAGSGERGAGSMDQHPPMPPHDESATPHRISASDWTPLQEHRDIAAVRNADVDAQLARFRERNNGQTDTDQGWSVRFTQWLGRAKPESRVTSEQVASPTLEEWMAYAREVSRGKGPDGEQWPKALAEAGWNENQAKQWRFVSDWKAECNARALRWAGQEATIAQRNRRGR